MKFTGKQLNDKQRYMIEAMLNEDSKLVDIANSLNRDTRGLNMKSLIIVIFTIKVDTIINALFKKM